MSGRPGTPAWAWAGISFGSGCRAGIGATAGRQGYSLAVSSASDQPSLFEIVISLDDFAQLVFGPFVPTVGVGMVTLDQLLEPSLDLVAFGTHGQVEGFERLSLQRLQRPPLGLPAARAPGEEIMGIGEAPRKAARLAHALLRAVRPGVCTHPPRRPMARHAVLLIG